MLDGRDEIIDGQPFTAHLLDMPAEGLSARSSRDRSRERDGDRDSEPGRDRDERRDKEGTDSCDSLPLRTHLSPVPISSASGAPTASTTVSSSQEDAYQTMATQLKHRADAMRGSGLSADGQRERAFLYTVAGVLFFLSTYRKASTAPAVTASPSSAATTSYKPILDFLSSVGQNVTEAPDLPVLLQLFQRVKAVVALQHSYTLLDSPQLAKSKTKEARRYLTRYQHRNKLTLHHFTQLTTALEAAEHHTAAREGWAAARKLAVPLGANEQPALYGLRPEGVELNGVGGVMEYVRRTLREVVERRKVVLSQPVRLVVIDVE